MEDKNVPDLDIREVPEELQYILKLHSRLVGQVMTQAEASIPQGKQCEQFKKLVKNDLYDFRKSVVDVVLYGDVPEEF